MGFKKGLTNPSGGKWILAGGGPTSPHAADRFIEACGRDGLIIVLPLATEDPKRDRTAEYLNGRGARNVVTFDVANPTSADRDRLAQLLAEAKGLWMPGGSQQRLMKRLGLEWAQQHICGRARAGMHLYGTSAGSMILSQTMITGPGRRRDTVRMGPGLALVSWVVDTHFAERSREPRLRHALRTSSRLHGTVNGLGIDEGSWALLRGDQIIETHGGVRRIEGYGLEPARKRLDRLSSLREFAREQLLRGRLQLRLLRSAANRF